MPNKYVTHLVKHIGIRSLELFIGCGEQDKLINVTWICLNQILYQIPNNGHSLAVLQIQWRNLKVQNLRLRILKQTGQANLEAVFQVPMPGDSGSNPIAGSISNYCLSQEIFHSNPSGILTFLTSPLTETRHYTSMCGPQYGCAACCVVSVLRLQGTAMTHDGNPSLLPLH